MTEITLGELKGYFDTAAKTIDQEVAKAVKATALEVAETQRQTVPVNTGRTQKSIKASGPNGAPFTATTVEAEVGPTWYVGRFIEKGTTTQPPRPFVSSSYEPHAQAHEARISAAMTTGALKGLTT